MGSRKALPGEAAVALERRVVARELAKRQRLPEALTALEATLFAPQRAFVMTPARRIVTWSGRRAGKTWGVTVRALRAASASPGAWVPIVERTTTCQSAQLIWRELQDVNERFGLGAKFHHTLLIATLPNRARIQVVGADTTEAADKLRGEHPPEVLIDEAGTFRPHILEYLLREVLEPALMDYQGVLTMAGTPAPRKAGPFAQACGVLPDATGGWERHHWTFMDNDALPLNMAGSSVVERAESRAAWFDALLTRYGWTTQSPWVRREYLGEWCEDEGGLIYRLAAFNHVGIVSPSTSETGWKFGLGIDFGYEDPTAFVVVGWCKGDPRLWVLESYEQTGLIPSAVAAHVERLRARYRFAFIVGDLGGYGKGPAEEMRQRFGIPIVGARKKGKESHVAFVNGDLVSGIILLPEAGNRTLIADLYALRRAEGDDWAEDARDANHLPDAFLYATMEQRASVGGLGKGDPPEVGSRAWVDAREAERERMAVEEYRGGVDPAAQDPGVEAISHLPEW